MAQWLRCSATNRKVAGSIPAGVIGFLALGSTQPLTEMSKSSPVTGLKWPRGFQEVKVPRFHDNSTGWW